MATSKSKQSSKGPVRRSSRASKAPTRFRPASADMPEEIAVMIRDVAASVAADSDVPFAPEAVSMLEEMLEPIFEALMIKALEHAVKAGREAITEADILAVRSSVVGKGKK